jgi:hypothetical protein
LTEQQDDPRRVAALREQAFQELVQRIDDALAPLDADDAAYLALAVIGYLQWYRGRERPPSQWPVIH